MRKEIGKKILCHGLAAAMAVTSAFAGAAALALPGTAVRAEAAEDEVQEIYKNGFEDGEYQGITGRGGVTLEVSTSVHHDVGNNSLSIGGRSAIWHGVQLSLKSLVSAGNTYDFRAYVKMDSDTEETCDMGVQYKDASGETQYVSLIGYGKPCGKDDWTELRGSFLVPETADEIAWYLQCSTSETAAFYLDDMTISGIPSGTQFKPDEELYGKMAESGVFSTGNNARIKEALQKAREGKDVSLAYIGGSVTEGGGYNPNSACYAEVSATAFAKKYGVDGGKNVHFINAGMSGTPSDIGIIRYNRDVVGRLPEGSSHPDILFIEFAVNDSGCETKGGAYEGLIRQALRSGSAVVLVFSVFNNLNRVEEMNYRKYGEAYDLPMVSTGDAIKDVYQEPGFYDWFYNDTLHPNANGYKLMADCILALMDRIDKEAETDAAVDVDSITAVTSDSYEGIKMIDSSTSPESDPAISAIQAGGFGGTDAAVPTYQYLYNGKAGEKWFPNNWMHDVSASNEPLTVEVNCQTFMLVYKETSESAYGAADLYVDGVKKSTLSCFNNSGWNNGKVCVALQEKTSAPHKIELKMKEGDENKKFTLYAIGYQTDAAAADPAPGNVKSLIGAIGEVTYDDACKAKIDAAREAYGKLTDAQKALVDNYQTLTDAEAKYAAYAAEKQAAQGVEALIGAIGEVTYDDACKAKIDAAREAYDKLTDAQKALVGNYQALTDAEAKYQSLAPAKKVDIKGASVGKIADQYYTGKAKKPSVSVTFQGKALKAGADYAVSYKNNTKIGTAAAVVKGIGAYEGEISATFQITVKKNAGYTVGNYKYKITDAKTNGKGTVSLVGVANKKAASLKVADTVAIGGKKFQITSIGSGAFSGCGKAASATVGKNVSKIGAKAFLNCKKLKKIAIKSTKLKSVGAKAFSGISKKASIKVPKSRRKAYQKLLAKKGQASGVKIVK